MNIAVFASHGGSDLQAIIYKNYWFANNVYKDAIVMQKCLS